MELRRAVQDQSEQHSHVGPGFQGKLSKSFAECFVAMHPRMVGHDLPLLLFRSTFQVRMKQSRPKRCLSQEKNGRLAEKVSGN